MTSGATSVGAAQETIASAAVEEEENRGFMIMRVGEVRALNDEDYGLTRAVMVPLINPPTTRGAETERRKDFLQFCRTPEQSCSG